MRIISLILILLVFMPTASASYEGVLRFAKDLVGYDCNLNNSSGTMEVMVLHLDTDGATACQFAVQVVGEPLTYIGHSSAYNTIGEAPTGISVAYGACLTSPIVALTLTYTGVSVPCDLLKLVNDPRPDTPGIYVFDCTSPDPVPYQLLGYANYINNDGRCTPG